MNVTGDMNDSVQFQCLSACVRDALISCRQTKTHPQLALYAAQIAAVEDIDVQENQVFQFLSDHPQQSTSTYTWKAYPESSPVQQIAAVLLLWHRAAKFPLHFASVISLQETHDDHQTLNNYTHLVHDALRQLHRANPLVDQAALQTLLQSLCIGGISRCLGMRRTMATIAHVVPPTYDVLVAAFRKPAAPMRPDARLTVGARALAKHCGRRGTGWVSSWWGAESELMTGSDDAKNARAEIVLFRVMSHCVWLNIHTIVGEEQVVELRVREGYGARWNATDSSFRGFLEIHMPNHAS